MPTVQVHLPTHLRRLAGVERTVDVEVEGEATLTAVLDVLETTFPALLGTIRDRATGERRAFMRYFVCGEDVSLDDPDQPLPDEVVAGREPVRIVGAIAGG